MRRYIPKGLILILLTIGPAFSVHFDYTKLGLVGFGATKINDILEQNFYLLITSTDINDNKYAEILMPMNNGPLIYAYEYNVEDMLDIKDNEKINDIIKKSSADFQCICGNYYLYCEVMKCIHCEVQPHFSHVWCFENWFGDINLMQCNGNRKMNVDINERQIGADITNIFNYHDEDEFWACPNTNVCIYLYLHLIIYSLYYEYILLLSVEFVFVVIFFFGVAGVVVVFYSKCVSAL